MLHVHSAGRPNLLHHSVHNACVDVHDYKSHVTALLQSAIQRQPQLKNRIPLGSNASTRHARLCEVLRDSSVQYKHDDSTEQELPTQCSMGQPAK